MKVPQQWFRCYYIYLINKTHEDTSLCKKMIRSIINVHGKDQERQMYVSVINIEYSMYKR